MARRAPVERRFGAFIAAPVAALVLGGCASRPLTRPADTGPVEATSIALAVGGVLALLTVHVARWMLRRPVTPADTVAMLLGFGVTIAALGSGFIFASHARAENLLQRSPGHEATTLVQLRASCGVTSGDGFLEVHVDPDNCSIDDGRGVVPILGVIGALLVGAALLLRRGQRTTPWFAAIVGPPVATLITMVGLAGVAPATGDQLLAITVAGLLVIFAGAVWRDGSSVSG